jgi:hypothetical protein
VLTLARRSGARKLRCESAQSSWSPPHPDAESNWKSLAPAQTVANELVRAGAITREEVCTRAVWQYTDEAKFYADQARGFLWALEMFLGAADTYVRTVRADDIPLTSVADAAPCAVVGGKDGA